MDESFCSRLGKRGAESCYVFKMEEGSFGDGFYVSVKTEGGVEDYTKISDCGSRGVDVPRDGEI